MFTVAVIYCGGCGGGSSQIVVNCLDLFRVEQSRWCVFVCDLARHDDAHSFENGKTYREACNIFLTTFNIILANNLMNI